MRHDIYYIILYSVPSLPTSPMLCRRAVVGHPASVRHINVMTVQDLLLAQSQGKSINPLTGRPATDQPAVPKPKTAEGGPPVVTGPAVYNSPESNPLSGKFMAKDLAGVRAGIRPTHRFDCVASRNNTITTFSSLTYSQDPFRPPTSNVLAWFSGGSVGFKKAQRATFEAGHQCAVRVFKLIEEVKAAHPDDTRVHIYFRGFGPGREATKTALLAAEGENIRDTIKQVIDRTPIKIGGTRAKKMRRL